MMSKEMSGIKAFEFQLSGEIKGTKGWETFRVELYDYDDPESLYPSIAKEISGPKFSEQIVTVPLEGKIKRLKKIQFLLVGEGDLNVEIANPHFIY